MARSTGTDSWPIQAERRGARRPLWIPPGIQKAKDRYPFSILWGLARELLDCDVLRIIGCRLSGNDWDLMSLLFSTRHIHVSGEGGYKIEVIDSPAHVFELKERYPYLELRSIYELEDLEVGEHFVAELLGGAPRSFEELDDDERARAQELKYGEQNWFRMWLEQMAEAFERDLAIPSTDTDSGEFQKMLRGDLE